MQRKDWFGKLEHIARRFLSLIVHILLPAKAEAVVKQAARSAINNHRAKQHAKQAWARHLSELFEDRYSLVKTVAHHQPERYVISLTTHGKRTNQLAPIAIACLMNQSTPADQVVLWLPRRERVGKRLARLRKLGLVIIRCDDLGPYTKLIPALHRYPFANIITADDDVLYPPNWLAGFIEGNRAHPTRIVTGRAHEIAIDDDELRPYVTWHHQMTEVGDERLVFPTGVGGILYPPASFDQRVFDMGLIMRLTPKADDIWFWAMARLNRTKYHLIEMAVDLRVMLINPANDDGLEANGNRDGGNDRQLRNVLNQFPVLKDFLGLAS